MLPSLSGMSLTPLSVSSSSDSAGYEYFYNTSFSPGYMLPSFIYALPDDNATSAGLEPAHWSAATTELLGLRGHVFMAKLNLTLLNGDDLTTEYELQHHGMAVADRNVTVNVTLVEGSSLEYTLPTGFLSLSGNDTFTWRPQDSSKSSHPVTTLDGTLSNAFKNDYVQSKSYSLHVGSVKKNISPSLILGGYDTARCIGTPITSSTQNVTITALSIHVASGLSAFNQSVPLPDNFLADDINVRVDPGVPYMYLPKDTCDALAEALPVKYHSEYDLYLWDRWDTGYNISQDIINSPHYINFTFAFAGDKTSTINIPFALMHLNLSYPFVDAVSTTNSLPYFPCRPTLDSPTLGRAFLQGAFLSQNWHTSEMILAQAPGPKPEPRYLDTIPIEGMEVEHMCRRDTDWATTWAGVLKPLGSTPPGDDTNAPPSLTKGQIAGISVGCTTFLASLFVLAFFTCRRKKQKGRALKAQRTERDKVASVSSDTITTAVSSLTAQELSPTAAVHESGGLPVIRELDPLAQVLEMGVRFVVVEMPADVRETGRRHSFG